MRLVIGMSSVIVGLIVLLGCGESERAKRAKVTRWVAQVKADPSLAEKEDFLSRLADYADLAAPEFAKLLKGQDKSVQIAALKVLASLRRLSVVDAIAAAAKSPDPDIRIEAAMTLATFASPLTVKVLVEMLKDPDPKVRAAALEGLGTRSDYDAPPYLREVLPYLVEGLHDPNPIVRRGAVRGLVKLGQWSLQAVTYIRETGPSHARKAAEEAFQSICEGFRKELRENTDRLIRRDMARYLGELRYGRAVVDLIDKLRNNPDPDPEVRAACAYALGAIGSRIALSALREVVGDRGEEMPVRLAAATALGRMGDPKGIQFLIDHLTDEEERVRTAALEALRLVGKPAVKLLMKAVQEKEPLKRWGAIAALGETGDPKVAPLLIRALQDKDESVRAVAAAALGKIRYAPAAPLLIRALTDESQRVQAYAEWALEQIGKTAIPALLEGAHNVKVQFRVFRLLGRLKAKEGVSALIEGLRRKDQRVRAIAAWALGEIGDPSSAPFLEKALHDPKASVRREAALALGKLGLPGYRRVLLERLVTDDESVRAAYAHALNTLTGIQRPIEAWLMEATKLPDPIGAKARSRWKTIREVF